MSTSSGPSSDSTPSTPSVSSTPASPAPAVETSAPATPSPAPTSEAAPSPSPTDASKPAPQAPQQSNAEDKQKEEDLKKLAEEQKKKKKQDEHPAPFMIVQDRKFPYDCDGPNSKLSMQFNEKQFKVVVEKLKQDKKFNAKYELKVGDKDGKFSLEVTQKSNPNNKCSMSYDNEKGLEVKGSKVTGLVAAYEAYQTFKRMKDTFTNEHTANVSVGGGNPDEGRSMQEQAENILGITGIAVMAAEKHDANPVVESQSTQEKTLTAAQEQEQESTQARSPSMGMGPK